MVSSTEGLLGMLWHHSGTGSSVEDVTVKERLNSTVQHLINGTSIDELDLETEEGLEWWWHPTLNVSIFAAVFAGGDTVCGQWSLLKHIYYQLAHTFLLLGYLAPSGRYGLLYLRTTVAIACAFFVLWGWMVECAIDTVLWNILLGAVNLVHVLVLLYWVRPIKFAHEIEQVYVSLFRPLKVSRRQFQKMLGCMRGIRSLAAQEIYAEEKVKRVDSLSLVLSGRLVVSQGGRPLHIVLPHQFLDSPEWFGVSTDEYFQVSITAMEDSQVLVWHRDKLRLTIISDQFLQAIFDHILGRDVVRKLVQVSEAMMASNNGHLPNHVDDTEDKPMLIVKKSDDGNGITSLIARQLQASLIPPSVDEGTGENAPLVEERDDGLQGEAILLSTPCSFHPPNKHAADSVVFGLHGAWSMLVGHRSRPSTLQWSHDKVVDIFENCKSC